MYLFQFLLSIFGRRRLLRYLFHFHLELNFHLEKIMSCTVRHSANTPPMQIMASRDSMINRKCFVIMFIVFNC